MSTLEVSPNAAKGESMPVHDLREYIDKVEERGLLKRFDGAEVGTALTLTTLELPVAIFGISPQTSESGKRNNSQR